MTTVLERSPDNFLSFFSLLKDKELAVSYFGDFSLELKNAILADIRRKLDLLEPKTTLRKRIYSISDESFDNIINYAKAVGQSSYQSLFSLIRDQNEYVLSIGNRVVTQHIEVLEERMKSITQMNAEQLAKEYTSVMTAPLADDAQGAGLGILIMAIRSGNKIDHLFEKLENDNYFFILRIKIS